MCGAEYTFALFAAFASWTDTSVIPTRVGYSVPQLLGFPSITYTL